MSGTYFFLGLACGFFGSAFGFGFGFSSTAGFGFNSAGFAFSAGGAGGLDENIFNISCLSFLLLRPTFFALDSEAQLLSPFSSP